MYILTFSMICVVLSNLSLDILIFDQNAVCLLSNFSNSVLYQFMAKNAHSAYLHSVQQLHSISNHVIALYKKHSCKMQKWSAALIVRLFILLCLTVASH